MKRLFLCILGGICISGSLSFGIGRSGNGLSSTTQGFAAQIPAPYSIGSPLGSEGIRLSSAIPEVFFSMTKIPSYFELHLLKEFYPELSHVDRNAFQHHFSQRGWQTLETKDICMEAFSSESETAVMIVASWGEGKGYLLLAPKSAKNQLAISHVFETTTLLERACAWKK